MIELRYEWRAQDDTANSLNDLFDLSLGVVAIGGPGAFLSFCPRRPGANKRPLRFSQ
jgi:hypothetical protein